MWYLVFQLCIYLSSRKGIGNIILDRLRWIDLISLFNKGSLMIYYNTWKTANLNLLCVRGRCIVSDIQVPLARKVYVWKLMKMAPEQQHCVLTKGLWVFYGIHWWKASLLSWEEITIHRRNNNYKKCIFPIKVVNADFLHLVLKLTKIIIITQETPFKLN